MLLLAILPLKKRDFLKTYISLGRHQMLIKSLINSDSDGLTFLLLAHNFNQVFFFLFLLFFCDSAFMPLFTAFLIYLELCYMGILAGSGIKED